MRCRTCDISYPEGSRFCGRCGQLLVSPGLWPARRRWFTLILMTVLLGGIASGAIIWRGELKRLVGEGQELWRGTKAEKSDAKSAEGPADQGSSREGALVEPTDLLEDPETLVVALIGTPAAPAATGRIVWNPKRGGIFEVFGIQGPSQGAIYHVWVSSADRQSVRSLVHFSTDESGMRRGSLPSASVDRNEVFFVTREVTGDLSHPQGPELLLGEVETKGPRSEGKSPGRGSTGTVVRARPAPAKGAGTAPAPRADERPSSPGTGGTRNDRISRPEAAAPVTTERPETPPSPPSAPSVPPPPVPTKPPPQQASSAGRAAPGGPVSSIFDAPVEAVRIASEKALRSFGWEIDTDRSTPGEGVFVTESRGLNFQDFGVYGEGLRHRLYLLVRPHTESRTSVVVWRELYHEKRIL